MTDSAIVTRCLALEAACERAWEGCGEWLFDAVDTYVCNDDGGEGSRGELLKVGLELGFEAARAGKTIFRVTVGARDGVGGYDCYFAAVTEGDAIARVEAAVAASLDHGPADEDEAASGAHPTGVCP